MSSTTTGYYCTEAFSEEEQFRRACLGRTHQSRPGTPFYVPEGHDLSSWTACKYCHDNGFDDRPKRPVIAEYGRRCNCDLATDPHHTRMEHGGLTIEVKVLPYKNVNAMKHKDSGGGYAAFALSTRTDYSVGIGLTDPGPGKFFTFSMTVGDKKVDIHPGRTVYFAQSSADPFQVEGLRMGADSGAGGNFCFVSSSNAEKEAGLAPADENSSNIIRVEAQLHRVQEDLKPVCLGMTRGLSASPNPAMAPRSAAPRPSVTGGATVSGSATVSGVSVVTTNKKYVPFGDPISLTVQLVCLQPDNEKEADNKKWAAHDAARKRKACEEEIREMQKRLRCLEEEKAEVGSRLRQKEELLASLPSLPSLPAVAAPQGDRQSQEASIMRFD